MKAVSKTLIIGLGGTGQRVIRDIKKRLFRTYGEIPPLVKFLAIDTDHYNEYEATSFFYYRNGDLCQTTDYNLQIDETFITTISSFEDIVGNPNCQTLDRFQLSRYFPICRGGEGAGGYRVLGRALILNRSHQLLGVLSDRIAQLRYAALTVEMQANGYFMANDRITVYVVASLAGGTGSSAIMDISRMLQIAGLNVHYNNDAALDKIFGVFFLPGFFEAKPNTVNIRINAYTALSELDYTMGLADPIRYALGCRELEDDRQDYIGNPNNGEHVIYDNVFLIDSHTSKGHTHSITDASIDVASFIAGSIAADPYTLISSYVNSDHKLQTVDGKHQNYSGLGYCEIRFCRQEFVNYLLNRKLLSFLEQYKFGEQPVEISHIVQSFININKLNEGVMRDAQGNDTRSQLNELTDTIIDMNDRRFSAIPMPIVETGREAEDAIEVSKVSYLSEIRGAAQQAIQAFASRKQELLQSLNTLLDHHMTKKGCVMFPELASNVKTMLMEMKDGLEDELSRNDEIFNRIDRHELRQLRIAIGENTSRGFLGIGSKRSEQEAYIRNYCNKVRFDEGSMTNPTLAWLVVDSARKREAVAIYEEMIGIVDSYYKVEAVETINGIQIKMTGSFLAVDGLFKALTDQFIREISSYRPAKAAVNETVFADAYFKEYFESHDAETLTLTEQNRDELDMYLGRLFADMPVVNEATLADMRQTLLDLMPTDGIIRCIQEGRLSIDELFIHCFGTYASIKDIADLEANPQLGLLEQLNHAIDPLWCYKHFTRQGLSPVKNLVVGVYDIQNHIFCSQNGYQAAIFRGNWDAHINYISLGDPDRIAFMVIETGIPACKLVDVSRWAIEYDHKKQYIYTFSDKRLEGIDMIMPGVYDEAEIAWAYGWSL